MSTPTPRSQGASEPAPERRLGLLLFGSLMSALFMAGLLLFAIDRTHNGSSSAAPECDEGFGEDCPFGFECVSGTCVELSDEPACPSGGTCSDACQCRYPRACDDGGLCVLPEEPDPRCSNAEVIDLLGRLDSIYTDCQAKAGGNNLASCVASDVRKFIIEGDDFDAVLRQFGEVLLFVFPPGKPHYDSRNIERVWPDKEALDHYTAFLREREAQIYESSRVIAIGRASRSRRVQQDYLFARARVSFVSDRLREVSQQSTVEGARIPKMLMFTVGSDRALSLEYLKDYPIRVIGWRGREEAMIGNTLAILKEGGTVDPRTRTELEDLINRSVLMVIVPCALSEASP